VKLDVIKKTCASCDKCPLSKTRERVVFGEGNPNASILFVGDYPTEVDSKYGRPMLGHIGDIFANLISEFGFVRNRDIPDSFEAFLAYAVMCSPPKKIKRFGTHTEVEYPPPSKESIRACRDWLLQTIYAIDPILIIAMGDVAINSLLGGKEDETHYIGKVGLIEVPGVAKPILVPVMSMPSPISLVNENSDAPDSFYLWSKYALQNAFQSVDLVSYDRLGELTPHLSSTVYAKPPKEAQIVFIPPDEPDIDDVLDDLPDNVGKAFDW
jgi:uracil-DNA glycosylase family 4